jgi:hypothetical protein
MVPPVLGGSARALECRSVMVFLDRWPASRNDITGRAGPAGMEVLGAAVSRISSTLWRIFVSSCMTTALPLALYFLAVAFFFMGI